MSLLMPTMGPVELWKEADVKQWLQRHPALASYAEKELKVQCSLLKKKKSECWLGD